MQNAHMRVHRIQKVQRVVVAASPQIKKRARLRRGLCRKVVYAPLRGREKVLRIDRPLAVGFESLTGYRSVD